MLTVIIHCHEGQRLGNSPLQAKLYISVFNRAVIEEIFPSLLPTTLHRDLPQVGELTYGRSSQRPAVGHGSTLPLVITELLHRLDLARTYEP